MVANAIQQYEEPRALLIAPSEFELMWRIAQVAHQSKMSGLQTPEQAMFIMLKGYEIGIKPMQALSGMNSIQGKPTMSPQLMLAMVRKSGQLEAIEIPDVKAIVDSCTVMVKRRHEREHHETYTMDMARSMGLAGKDNWKKQPAVMLRWRTVSAALRMVFPDIIEGLYMPEEIDPDTVVDENGAVIGDTPTNVVQMPRQEAPKPPVLEAYNTAPVDGSGALIPDVVEREEPPVIRGNGTTPTRLNEPVDWRKPVIFFKRVADMGLPTEGIVGKIEPGKNTPAEITLEWAEVESRLMTLKDEMRPGRSFGGFPTYKALIDRLWDELEDTGLYTAYSHMENTYKKEKREGRIADDATYEQIYTALKNHVSGHKKAEKAAARDGKTNFYDDLKKEAPHEDFLLVAHSIQYNPAKGDKDAHWTFLATSIRGTEERVNESHEQFVIVTTPLPKLWDEFFADVRERTRNEGKSNPVAMPEKLELTCHFNQNGRAAVRGLRIEKPVAF